MSKEANNNENKMIRSDDCYFRGTTLFFSSKILLFRLSFDFPKFDVSSSNFSSMKMLFIDGAFSKLIIALPPNALPPNALPPNALPPKAYRPNAHRLTARRT